MRPYLVLLSFIFFSSYPTIGQLTCNNWLLTPSISSGVTVGDLDIVGNQLTVEAVFNRGSAFDPTINFGKLVSKHTDATNVNYSLMPVTCEITTTNGYVNTPPVCIPSLDKTYHVAMVYDGATLKFYRNGFLMSSVAWTGNLVNNDLLATIGQGPLLTDPTYQNFGYINEVRIWNVARTQAEIRANMATALPSPATQPGLQAYYTFDDLLNKQGNAAWNGTLQGAATINEINPTCAGFVADSCAITCNISEDFNSTPDICKPLSVQFQSTAVLSNYDEVKWDFGDGHTSFATTNPVNIYSADGNYDIEMIVIKGGCSDTARKSISVTASNNKVLINNNDTLVCAGSPVPLNATGGISYTWSPATGLTNPTIATPVATPVTNTQYIVTGTFANGCKATDTLNININPKPVISKSPDTSICKNSSLQLYSNGGNSYSWSPSSGLNDPLSPIPIATPQITTTYKVVVTDLNNCSNTDSIKITIRPDPLFTISEDADICSNRTANLSASGGDQYSWQPSASLNNGSIHNPVATPVISTTYTVLITDTVCGNTKSLSTTITVLRSPVVVANRSNDVDCSTITSQLSASGAAQYSWTPVTSLNDGAIPNPIASPRVPTKYIVTGTSTEGCSSSDSVLVDVKAINKGLYLMPSAFTPNNDGKNDCYGAKSWGFIADFDFSIFNRWGERIFHTINPTQCWDGTYKGVPQNPDVYVYIVKGKSICESSIFRKGTIMLIR